MHTKSINKKKHSIKPSIFSDHLTVLDFFYSFSSTMTDVFMVSDNGKNLQVRSQFSQTWSTAMNRGQLCRERWYDDNKMNLGS